MLRHRRLLAALLSAVALGAGACGAPPEPEQTGNQGQGRVIDHAMGKTTINGTPKRVVVLDTGELDAALALGVKPVGAVLPAANSKIQPYLAEKAGNVEMVGTIGSPNIEKIAKLKPDLILSSKTRDEENYDALSKIAPTVMAETVGKTWKENFLLDAEALGKKPKAEQILADYKKRAAEIGQRAGDPGAQKVSMLRFSTGNIRLYSKNSFIGTILTDAGFARPQNQQVDKTFTKLSREQISQADGDILFYGAYGETGAKEMNEVVNSVQWSTLGAAKANKTFEVPDGTWYLGLGPIAANLVLDDLERILG